MMILQPGRLTFLAAFFFVQPSPRPFAIADDEYNTLESTVPFVLAMGGNFGSDRRIPSTSW